MSSRASIKARTGTTCPYPFCVTRPDPGRISASTASRRGPAVTSARPATRWKNTSRKSGTSTGCVRRPCRQSTGERNTGCRRCVPSSACCTKTPTASRSCAGCRRAPRLRGQRRAASGVALLHVGFIPPRFPQSGHSPECPTRGATDGSWPRSTDACDSGFRRPDCFCRSWAQDLWPKVRSDPSET